MIVEKSLQRGFYQGLGRGGILLLGGVLFLKKWVGNLYLFVAVEEESLMKIDIHLLIKARDPFLEI